MKRRCLLPCIIFLLFSVSCSESENPVPTASSISPDSAVAHMSTITLTITGSNFVSSSSVVFNGVEKATTFVSGTELTCQLSPDDTAITVSTNADSVDDSTVQVLIRNPQPGGGDSGALSFTIKANPTFRSTFDRFFSSTRSSEDPYLFLSSAGNPYLSFTRYEGEERPWYCYSEDGGTTWTAPLKIEPQYGEDLEMTSLIYRSSSNHYILVGKRAKCGMSCYWWKPAARGGFYAIDNNKTDDFPSLVMDGTGRGHLLWQRTNGTTKNDEVIYTRTTSTSNFTMFNNNPWSVKVSDSNDSAKTSFQQSLATDSSGNNVYAVWYEIRDGSSFTIRFSKSTNAGDDWSVPIHPRDAYANEPEHMYIADYNNSINEGDEPPDKNRSEYDICPVIAADDSGNVCVIYVSPRGLFWFDIVSYHSSDGGETWSDKVIIADFVRHGKYPSVAIDGNGNINVAWMHVPSGKTRGDIFYSRSFDKGQTWSTRLNISSNNGSSRCPIIRVNSAGEVFIAWHDDNTSPGSGKYDIYFTKTLSE